MHALSGERLVFLPGLDGTGISYEPLSPFMASDADVTVVRYPNDELQSFEETVECAARQVSSADGAVVVAESFSGPVAVELIASGRLKAKCLVMSATFARSPRPFLLNVARCLPLSLIMGVPLPEATLMRAFRGPEYTAYFIPLVRRVREMVPAEVLAHRLRIVSRVDVRRRLPLLSLPCLYIQASDDRAVPSTAVLDFVESIPHLEVRTLQGPHFILQARPRMSVEAIEEFRNTHRSPSSSVTSGGCP